MNHGICDYTCQTCCTHMVVLNHPINSQGFYDIISQSSWVNIPTLIGYNSISIVVGAIRVIMAQAWPTPWLMQSRCEQPFEADVQIPHSWDICQLLLLLWLSHSGLSKTRVPVLPLVIISPVNPPFSIIFISLWVKSHCTPQCYHTPPSYHHIQHLMYPNIICVYPFLLGNHHLKPLVLV